MATYNKKDFNNLESGETYTVTATTNEGYGVEDVKENVTASSTVPTSSEPTGGTSISYTGGTTPSGALNTDIKTGTITFTATANTPERKYYIKAKQIRFKVLAAITSGQDTYGSVSVSGVDSNSSVPYNNDTAATVTATPKDPCTFAGWTKSGGGSTDTITPSSSTALTKSLTTLKVNDVTMTANFNCVAAVADPYGNVVQGGTTSWVLLNNVYVPENQRCDFFKYSPTTSEINTQKNNCSKSYLRVYDAHYEVVNDSQVTYYTHKYVCKSMSTDSQKYFVAPTGSNYYFNKNNAIIYRSVDNTSIYVSGNIVKGYTATNTLSYNSTNGYTTPTAYSSTLQNTGSLLYGHSNQFLFNAPSTPPIWNNNLEHSSWIGIEVPHSVFSPNNWNSAFTTISTILDSHFDFSEIYSQLPQSWSTRDMTMFNAGNADTKGFFGWFQLVYEQHVASVNIIGQDDLLYYFINDVTFSGTNITKLRNQFISPESPEYITIYDNQNVRNVYRKVVTKDEIWAKTMSGTTINGEQTLTNPGTTGVKFNYKSGECGILNGWYEDNNGTRDYVTDTQGNNKPELTVKEPDACCTRYFPDIKSCSDIYVPYAYYNRNNNDCKRIAFIQITQNEASGNSLFPLNTSNMDLSISDGNIGGDYYYLESGQTFDCDGCYLVMTKQSGQIVGNYSLNSSTRELTLITSASSSGVSYHLVDSVTAGGNNYYFRTAYIAENGNKFKDGTIEVSLDSDTGYPETSTYYIGNTQVVGFENVLKSGYGFLYINNSSYGTYNGRQYYGNVVYKNVCGINKSAYILTCPGDDLSSILATETKYVPYGFSYTDSGTSSITRYFKDYKEMDNSYYNNSSNNYNAITVNNGEFYAINQTYPEAPSYIVNNGSIVTHQNYINDINNESVYLMKINLDNNGYYNSFLYVYDSYGDWNDFQYIPWVINNNSDKKLLVFTENRTPAPYWGTSSNTIEGSRYIVQDYENGGMKVITQLDESDPETTYKINIIPAYSVYTIGNPYSYSNTATEAEMQSELYFGYNNGNVLAYKPIWHVRTLEDFIYAYEKNIPYINIESYITVPFIDYMNGGTLMNGKSFSNGYYYLGFNSVVHTNDEITSKYYLDDGYYYFNTDKAVPPTGTNLDNQLRNNNVVIGVSNLNSDVIPTQTSLFCDKNGFDERGYYVGVPTNATVRQYIYGLPYYNGSYIHDNGISETVELMHEGYRVTCTNVLEQNEVTLGYDGCTYGINYTGGFVDFCDESIVVWYKLSDNGYEQTIYNHLLDNITTTKISLNGVNYFQLTAPTSNVSNPKGRDYVRMNTTPSGATTVSTAQELGTYLNDGSVPPPPYIQIGSNDIVLYGGNIYSPDYYDNWGNSDVFQGIRFLANNYYELKQNDCYRINLNTLLPSGTWVNPSYDLQFLGWLIESEPHYTFYCDRLGNSNGAKKDFPFTEGYVQISETELQNRAYLYSLSEYLDYAAYFPSTLYSYDGGNTAYAAYIEINPNDCSVPLDSSIIQSCMVVHDLFQLEYALEWGKDFKIEAYTSSDFDNVDFSDGYYYLGYLWYGNIAIAYNHDLPWFLSNVNESYKGVDYVEGQYYINNVAKYMIYNQEDADYVLSKNTDSYFYVIADYEEIDNFPSDSTHTTISNFAELRVAVESNVEYIEIDMDYVCDNSLDIFGYRYNIYKNGSKYKRNQIRIGSNVYFGGDVIQRVIDRNFFTKEATVKALTCETCTAVYSSNFFVNFCEGAGNGCIEGWHIGGGYSYDGVPMSPCSPTLDHRHFINNHNLQLIFATMSDYTQWFNWRSNRCNSFGGYRPGCYKFMFSGEPYYIERGIENDIYTYIAGLLPSCSTSNGLMPIGSCESKIITNSSGTVLQTEDTPYEYNKLVYYAYNTSGGINTTASKIFTWNSSQNKYVRGSYSSSAATDAYVIYKDWNNTSSVLYNKVKNGCFRARITKTRSYNSDLLNSTYQFNSYYVGDIIDLKRAVSSFAQFVYVSNTTVSVVNNGMGAAGYSFRFESDNFYYINYERVYNLSDITNYRFNSDEFCDLFIIVFRPDINYSVNPGYYMWQHCDYSVTSGYTVVSTEDDIRDASATHFDATTGNEITFIKVDNSISQDLVYQGYTFYKGSVYKWVSYENCPTHSLVYGDCTYPFKVLVSNIQQLNAPIMTYDNAGHVTMSSNNSGVSGVQIRYTDNGNTPTASSTLYSGAITFSGTKTFKAICIANGWIDSNVTTNTYTYEPPQQLTEPVVTEVYNG